MIKAMRSLVIITLLVVIVGLPFETQSFETHPLYNAVISAKKDNEAALKHFWPLTEQALGLAQPWLGIIYAAGNGVTQNDAVALRLGRKATRQGDTTGQYLPDDRHKDGLYLTKAPKKAVNWHRKAAEKGDARAHFNLGYMYAKGQGVTKDYKEAVRWFHKAAMQGYASAQRNLGAMYAKGQGVAQNDVLASVWTNVAAANGDEKAIRAAEDYSKNLDKSELKKVQKLARLCYDKPARCPHYSFQ